MVSISVRDSVVVINILGIHKILALKSKIEINKKNIKNVEIAETKLHPPLFRFPGTRIPGIIAAGTFIKSNNREFWDHIKGKKAIAIETENENYTRIVVDVKQPEEIIKLLNNP